MIGISMAESQNQSNHINKLHLIALRLGLNDTAIIIDKSKAKKSMITKINL